MKTTLLKIDNIMYRVKDLQEGEWFYRDVLGLKKVYALLEDPDGNQIPIIDLTSFAGQPRYD